MGNTIGAYTRYIIILFICTNINMKARLYDHQQLKVISLFVRVIMAENETPKKGAGRLASVQMESHV